MMETVRGRVLDIVFSTEDTGYAVIRIFTDKAEAYVLTGTMPFVNCGETIEAEGEWTDHPSYGRQFKVKTFSKTMPDRKDDMILYLSSGVIRGVGKAMAQRIVKHFGTATMDVMLSQPERLAEIKGISPRKAAEIGESFRENQAMQGIISFFAGLGLSTGVAFKARNKLGALCVNAVRNNPYLLADPDFRIGFRNVDKIARDMNYDMDSVNRTEAAVRYMLAAMSMNGSTCMERDELARVVADNIGSDRERVAEVIDDMTLSAKLMGLEMSGAKRVYTPELYRAEVSASRILSRLAPVTFDGVGGILSRLAEMSGDETLCGAKLSEEQTDAVRNVVTRAVSVVTGGPGTGKTTIIKCIVELFSSFGFQVALAAPTGRAAKRMSEASGWEAQTIHRMLEIGYTDDTKSKFIFRRDEGNPLDADVLIIDEMSMMDIQIMEATLKALKPGSRLVLVGDADQLPSVGPGKVLQDIMDSGVCVVTRLTQVYRQAAESMIIMNAHRINRGEQPIVNAAGKDFFFVDAHSRESLYSRLILLCREKLPKVFGMNPDTDIQVITPTRQGDAGVGALNRVLQEALNPPALNKAEKKAGDTVFRVGDRVMQNRNNYDMVCTRPGRIDEEYGVYNGDLGVIRRINNVIGTVEVELSDGRTCVYDSSNIEELEQAFAVTVHKSQGSEFPCVVLVLFGGPVKLQNRNLLYTAVTRAKQLLVVIGIDKVMANMVSCERPSDRLSSLRELLVSHCECGTQQFF